jgi:hypothetical protein
MVTMTGRRRGPPPLLKARGSDDKDGEMSSVSSPYDSDESDYDSEGSCSTALTEPEPEPLPRRSGRTRLDDIPSESPDYSDDQDDETDEDLADVPLDYGRSDKTKLRGARMEKRWHK